MSKDDNNGRDGPNTLEKHNLTRKNTPKTKNDKNTKADHMAEPPNNNRTGSMLKLLTGKNDPQETTFLPSAQIPRCGATSTAPNWDQKTQHRL